jgi:pimeloyl-ACP methyl ester carboxylesterase
MKLARTLLGVAAAALGLASVSPVWAQQAQRPPGPVAVAGIKTSFIALGSGVPGVLYEPTEPGPKAQIAVLVMHSGADYLTHSACTELSKRGYRVLCANTSGDKSGTFDTGRLDGSILEASQGVKFLRGYAGVRKVVIWGHSGGGTLMTAYQSIAENGVKVCQDAQKIHQCPNTLAGLPAADGVILGDTNIGLGTITLLSVDPAIIDNSSGLKLDPALDMYNPQNGYKADGTTTYSEAFRRKFFKAEAERNNAIIKLAEERLAAIKAGKGQFKDDEPFFIPGGYIGNNRLLSMDLGLMSRSRKPWPLVHADGSVTTEIIQGRRVARPSENPSAYYRRGAIKTTVEGFLTSYAIRADANAYDYGADTIRGIKWTSTYASPPGNVQSISAPLLLLGMTGSYEGWAGETIYELARSADKELAFIDGATHGYGTCKLCEKVPGEFGDTQKTTYDYAAQWLGKPGRFL